MIDPAPMVKRNKAAIGAGLTVFFVMFSSLAVGLARAEDALPAAPDQTAAERAKRHFAQGEGYFKSHKFEEALDEYRLGYLEKPSPVFTFNMAQCHRLLGHRGPAIELYRRYLLEAPDGGGRALAEQRIAELTAEGKPDKGDELGAATPTAPPPADLPPSSTTLEASPAGAEPTAVAIPTAASDVLAPAHSPASGADVAAPSALEPAPKPVAAPLLVAKLAAPAPSVSVSARAEERERPIYRRWWFWGAAAAIATGTVIAIASSSSGRPACDPDRLCK